MSDPDQPGERLDDELLPDEYPPDPDGERPADPEVELLGDEDVGAVSDEDRLVARAVGDDDRRVGPLAEDDEFTGDETTRDVATERVPPPMEEVAVHVEYDEDERY
jgi:hypothetical protein